MHQRAGIKRVLWIGLVLGTLWLSACRPTTSFLSAIRETTLPPTPFPSTPTAASTSTPVPQCAYVWLNKELPDVSRLVNQAMIAAGMPDTQVQAVAYGENCLDVDTNAVVSFSVMQTDFYLVAQVEGDLDAEGMGNSIEKIEKVFMGIPAGKIPGPNLGQITIQFSKGNKAQTVSFDRKKAEDLIRQGVHGSALYEALIAVP